MHKSLSDGKRENWQPWKCSLGGWNSSVGSMLVLLPCVMHRGFDPPLSLWQRGFFLGVNMDSDSIPKNSFGWEHKLKSSLCTHAFMDSDCIPKNSFGWEHKLKSSLCTHAFHHMDSKDPDIHVLNGWTLATKTHSVCAIHEDGMWLPLWLDWKTVTYTQISPNNDETQREHRRRRRSSLLKYYWC